MAIFPHQLWTTKKINWRRKVFFNSFIFSNTFFSSLTWVRSDMTSASSIQRYILCLLFARLPCYGTTGLNYDLSHTSGVRLWLAWPPRSSPGQDLQHLQSHGHVAERWQPQRGGDSQQGEAEGTVVRKKMDFLGSRWCCQAPLCWFCVPYERNNRDPGWSDCAWHCATLCSCFGSEGVRKHKLGKEGITVIMAASVYLPFYPQMCHKVWVDQSFPAVASH